MKLSPNADVIYAQIEDSYLNILELIKKNDLFNAGYHYHDMEHIREEIVRCHRNGIIKKWEKELLIGELSYRMVNLIDIVEGK
nr:MAG TPA: hypothetical protein [Caudoviricetes sp.]